MAAVVVVGLLVSGVGAGPAVAAPQPVVAPGGGQAQEWVSSDLAGTTREVGQHLWGAGVIMVQSLVGGLAVPVPETGGPSGAQVEARCRAVLKPLTKELAGLDKKASLLKNLTGEWAQGLKQRATVARVTAAAARYKELRAAYDQARDAGAGAVELDALLPGLEQAYAQVWRPFAAVDGLWSNAAQVRRTSKFLYLSAASDRRGYARWVDKVGSDADVAGCRSTQVYAEVARASAQQLAAAYRHNASIRAAWTEVKAAGVGLARIASRVRALPGAPPLVDHSGDVPARALRGVKIEGPEPWAQPWTAAALRVQNTAAGGTSAFWGAGAKAVYSFTPRVLSPATAGTAPAGCARTIEVLQTRLDALTGKALALEKAATALDTALAPARPPEVMRNAASDYHRARAAWIGAVADGSAQTPAVRAELVAQLEARWAATWAPLTAVQEQWIDLAKLTTRSQILYSSTPDGLETSTNTGGFGNWYSRAVRDLPGCTSDPTYPALLAEHDRVSGVVTAASTRTTALLTAGKGTAGDQAWTASRVKPWPTDLPVPAPAVPAPAGDHEIDWDQWVIDWNQWDQLIDFDFDPDPDPDPGQGAGTVPASTQGPLAPTTSSTSGTGGKDTCCPVT